MRTMHTQRDLTGRYEIRLVEPGRWELLRGGIRHSLHKTASAARSTAARSEGLRRLRLVLLHKGVLILLVGLGIGLATGFRTMPNPDRGPAVGFTDRLGAAYLAVVAGDGDLDSFRLESDGFKGATVDGPPAFGIETGESQPADPVRISLLIGELEGTCYSVRWEEPEWPVAGILRPDLPCTPVSKAGMSPSYVRTASSTQPRVVYWDPLLPEPQLQAGWFFPVVLVLLGTGLWSAVGVTLALLRHRAGRTISLRWSDPDGHP